jgi:hypothetical protein
MLVFGSWAPMSALARRADGRRPHDYVIGTSSGSLGAARGADQPGSIDDACRRLHAGPFSAALSTGSFRTRLPVAAKIALVMAGTIAEVPASPIPPGGSRLWTM